MTASEEKSLSLEEALEELSLTRAVRQAVLAGEVDFQDATPLLF